MKTTFFTGCLLFASLLACAQAGKPLKIDDCYVMAKQNYPLSKQKELIEKSRDYSVENASKGFLPQLNFAGQATYQSAVTELPIHIPGVSIPELNRDQYKIYGEIDQPVTDAITIRQQKDLLKASAVIEDQSLEVELYKLKDRINQLYFGALLIDEQLAQNELLKKDIENGIAKTTAAVANGISYKSNLSILKAELLKNNQHSIELKASRKAYIEMLGLFINQPLGEETQLEKPQPKILSENINRPELTLFDYQKKSIDIQNKLLTSKNIPHIGLFFQEGYARPGLNFLTNSFDFYYIGGVRFSWSVSGFYTLKKERRILDINRSLIDVQKDVFMFNTGLAVKQQSDEMKKLEDLISVDTDIISLRTEVKNAANAQLENGVITANDYLREVNAEDQARQNLLLHQVQLLIAQYSYQNATGN